MNEEVKRILGQVDKQLAEIEEKRKGIDATGQQRADILSGLLERAKKNNCLIVVYNPKGGDRLEIIPSETAPEGIVLMANGIFIRGDMLKSARSESSRVAKALAALLRDQWKILVHKG